VAAVNANMTAASCDDKHTVDKLCRKWANPDAASRHLPA